jgi:hypothetical protein
LPFGTVVVGSGETTADEHVAVIVQVRLAGVGSVDLASDQLRL